MHYHFISQAPLRGDARRRRAARMRPRCTAIATARRASRSRRRSPPGATCCSTSTGRAPSSSTRRCATTSSACSCCRRRRAELKHAAGAARGGLPATSSRAGCATPREEIAHWTEYDYVLVNRDLDKSFARLRAILTAERLKRVRQAEPGRLRRRAAGRSAEDRRAAVSAALTARSTTRPTTLPARRSSSEACAALTAGAR